MVTGPVGFDLDMTLIDSRPAIMAAFVALSNEVGTRIDLEQVDARLGVKLEDELAQAIATEDRTEITALLDLARQTYRVIKARGKKNHPPRSLQLH